MNALQVTDLSFAYGSRAILTGACVAPLRPGKLTALIGPKVTLSPDAICRIAGSNTLMTLASLQSALSIMTEW
ncbi:MAG: hypothetical protein R8G34_11655 [Paracoccaceae bacterium]|nr:hypothetical protein [Paracoccaceae bacterium]